MTRRSILLVCLLLGLSSAGAVPPAVEWQRSFGGSGSDVLYSIQQTADGGYILGGESASGTNGNKTSPNFGLKDFWVVRLDASGNKLWEQSFGGSGDDQLFDVKQTSDGGFILGGSSSSPLSGNKSTAGFGGRDFWVVRLGSNGVKIWDRTYGGSSDEALFALRETTNGGFMLGGFSASSTSGNKSSANFGELDFWVVRIDANGTHLWDQSFGGSGDEGIYSLQITTDGGFVLAGDSFSPADGNKTSMNWGMDDIWIVRLDAAGNKLWDQSYGGGADDGLFNVRVVQTFDGGFLVGGDSASETNSVKTSPHYGNDDFWVVRLDGSGNRLWDKSFGGTLNDYLTSLQQTPDAGFLLAGGSNSNTNESKRAANYGATDYWLVRLDANGNKLWDQTFGGTSDDAFFNVTTQLTSDGGMVVGGDSRSNTNGNKTATNWGSYDYWLLKLTGTQRPRIRAQPQSNVAQNGFHFFLSGESNATYVVEFSPTSACGRR